MIFLAFLPLFGTKFYLDAVAASKISKIDFFLIVGHFSITPLGCPLKGAVSILYIYTYETTYIHWYQGSNLGRGSGRMVRDRFLINESGTVVKMPWNCIFCSFRGVLGQKFRSVPYHLIKG